MSSVLKSNQIAQHVTAEGMAKAKAAAARANGGRSKSEKELTYLGLLTIKKA